MGVAGETTYRCQAPPPAPEIAIPDVDAAVRDAIARRPERASLVQKVKAAEGTRTVAMSGWYPTIGANAGLAYTGYKVDDMVYNWNLGATVTWNFFSGLYTRAAVREAEANLAALRASLASLDLSIRSEVESAAIAYREARERIAPARALLASAAETLELAEGRYAAGAGNIVEVTDATAVKTQADVGLIQAQYDIESARVRLLKVLGVLVPRADGHSPGKED
jgi:outer membrane protein